MESENWIDCGVGNMTTALKHRQEVEHRKFVHRHCEGKRRITSRRKARHIAKRMTIKKHTPFVAYRCDVCGFYHVGHEKTPFRIFMLSPIRRRGRAA